MDGVSVSPVTGPTQGGGGLPVSDTDYLLSCVGDVFDLVGNILAFVVDNPVLCFLLAAGFVSVGITVFSKLKKVAK